MVKLVEGQPFKCLALRKLRLKKDNYKKLVKQ